MNLKHTVARVIVDFVVRHLDEAELLAFCIIGNAAKTSAEVLLAAINRAWHDLFSCPADINNDWARAEVRYCDGANSMSKFA